MLPRFLKFSCMKTLVQLHCWIFRRVNNTCQLNVEKGQEKIATYIYEPSPRSVHCYHGSAVQHESYLVVCIGTHAQLLQHKGFLLKLLIMTVLLLYSWNHHYSTLSVKGWAEDYQRHTKNRCLRGVKFFYPMRTIKFTPFHQEKKTTGFIFAVITISNLITDVSIKSKQLCRKSKIQEVSPIPLCIISTSSTCLSFIYSKDSNCVLSISSLQ